MKVAWEEPFGPVLPIIRVTNVEEAIAFANESEFGLNLQSLQMISKRPLKLLKNLKWVQFILIIKPKRGPDNFPFLGVKGSGAGVQGIKYSIEAMTNVKSIVLM